MTEDKFLQPPKSTFISLLFHVPICTSEILWNKFCVRKVKREAIQLCDCYLPVLFKKNSIFLLMWFQCYLFLLSFFFKANYNQALSYKFSWGYLGCILNFIHCTKIDLFCFAFKLMLMQKGRKRAESKIFPKEYVWFWCWE